MVTVNGEQAADAAGKTILDYLTEHGYPGRYVAVECNGEIVPKATFEERVIQDGDTIEVVRFVGGG